jgi:hypothetical protein
MEKVEEIKTVHAVRRNRSYLKKTAVGLQENYKTKRVLIEI